MIYYLKGDATEPQVADGDRFLIHICNSCGGWGKGFVLAISKKWKAPEKQYRANIKQMKLGDIQIVKVEDALYVVNMIAQNGYKSMNNPVPVSYVALENCLEKLQNELKNYNNPTIHMPRIGCGLGGGRWFEIERLINIFDAVYVYDF